MNKDEKKYYDYINSFPEWYWSYGLHDAEILNIQRKELLADYNFKDPKYNRMEILLDCAGSLGEADVTKIIIYNHKIISDSLPKCEQCNVWWIGDKLSKTSEDYYKLELEFADESDKRYFPIITFQTAEVIRKE